GLLVIPVADMFTPPLSAKFPSPSRGSFATRKGRHSLESGNPDFFDFYLLSFHPGCPPSPFATLMRKSMRKPLRDANGADALKAESARTLPTRFNSEPARA
ncbi:MAG TPA: hypothetical protein VLS90_15800, partial [Thermodesulfobacteriota bacterium]|nr:hypothetical protein [Thermodesulfobacteriota bacterium]